MVRDAIRSVWAEPAASDPPGPLLRDWLLAAAFAIGAVVESVLRPELAWRPLVTAVAVAGVLVLPWRRVEPLAMLAIAFGAVTVLDVATLVALDETTGLGTMAYLVLLFYALARWASGRDALVGVALLTVPVSLGIYIDWTGVGDAIGALAVVLSALALGAAVRSRVNVRTREHQQIKSLERERLARELHDTVAHHVSAIAIQAQAGRALARTRPEAAVDALTTIEAAASETLTDMRAMVRILRDDEAAELAPQGGVADIRRLADRAGDHVEVDLEMTGAVGDLPPAIDAAAYRLAQESITNAMRHATGATRVQIRIDVSAGVLRLTVRDDGDTSDTGAPIVPGYGLAGMAERARLLGGTCVASADPTGGWLVTAELPLAGPVERAR